MSRNAPALVSTLPVAPGTAVVTPMYTSVGFNAGDYVYQYGANLVGWPKGSTVSMGANNTLIAGNTYTGYAQTADSRAVSYGPFTDQITYSGTTTTVGQTIVSPTTLSGVTYANGACRCAVLTGGNVAYIYRGTGSTNLSGAIYNSAGVLQGSVVTLTTSLTYTDTTLSICAMPDGGYIATWYEGASTNFFFSRVSSANAVTYGPAALGGGAATSNGSIFAATTQNYYALSYNLSLGNTTAVLRIYNLSNGSTGQYNPTFTNISNTCCAGTNSDTFYLGVGDYGANNFNIHHVAVNGTQIGAGVTVSSNSTYRWIAACGSTANSTYAGSYSAWFMFPNSSGQLQIYRVYASSATTPSYTGGNQGTQMTQAAVASTNNGGAMLVYRNSSTGILQAASFNAAANQVGSTVTLVASAVPDVAIGASGFAGASFAYGYGANATSYPTLQTAYSVAYTNGVTSLTGTNSYTPANGYYVLGVALTTAAAGATGMVATNGSANLGASYPNVTSNILFDYTGTAFTARSAINAQRGNVIGTNVTLRGLE
jgi:hypothetical protein